MIFRVKAGVTDPYTSSGGSFPASTYAIGEDSYYLVAVDSTGTEGTRSTMAIFSFLPPLSIAPPIFGQSPLSPALTFQWTTDSNFPAGSPQFLAVFDKASTTNPYWVVGGSFGGSTIYKGPALDSTKQYRVSVYGSSGVTDTTGTINRLDLPISPIDFTVPASTTAVARNSNSNLAATLAALTDLIKKLQELLKQL